MTSRRIHLVRHGLSTMERGRPPHEWGLDPAGHAAIDELRDSGRLPEAARWFSSPETKALETARRLTDSEVTVVPELREHERHSTVWFEDPAQFRAAVRRAFEVPDEPALEGWEPLAAARDRLLPVVRRILADHPGEEVVLSGHGTAWTLLVSELSGRPPDLEAWARLRMPDYWVVETAVD
jgi:broad specificity phosphatase PhoE